MGILCCLVGCFLLFYGLLLVFFIQFWAFNEVVYSFYNVLTHVHTKFLPPFRQYTMSLI